MSCLRPRKVTQRPKQPVQPRLVSEVRVSGCARSHNPSACGDCSTNGAPALSGARQFAQPRGRAIPSLLHEVLSEVSAPSELIGSSQSPVPRFVQHCPRTEAPSLHRHYPVSTVIRASRHPRRPSLALTGYRLARTPRHRWGFPCCVGSPLCMHAVATTPAVSLGALIARFPSDGGLPRIRGGSASALCVSRPAQRSLHVTACILAKSLK